MKSEEEVNAAILKLEMLIMDKYPELSKYLLEMPETIPDELHPKMSMKTLHGYYTTLEGLLKKYATNHTEVKK
jgi:hypothetical protein